MALASTESATSRQSATSQCLCELPGRLGRGKFVLDGLGWKKINIAPITPIGRLPGDSAPLGVIFLFLFVCFFVSTLKLFFEIFNKQDSYV